MKIGDLSISYPDFKINDVMNPDEFDINNKEIVDSVNEIIAKLNIITDSRTDGNSGADNVKVTGIEGLSGTTVQSLLESLNYELSLKTGYDYVNNAVSQYIFDGIPDQSLTEDKIHPDFIEKIENKIKNSNNGGFELNLPYYYHTNIGFSETFQNLDEWVSDENTIIDADLENNFFGVESIKMVNNVFAAGKRTITKALQNVDMTKFNDGSDSTDDDFIVFAFFIDGLWVGEEGTGMKLVFENSVGNGFEYNITREDITSYFGNEYFCVPKSAFTRVGEGSWQDIIFLRFEWDVDENRKNNYISFDLLQLVRKGDQKYDLNIPVIFQRRNDDYEFINDFEQDKKFCLALIDGNLVCRVLPSNSHYTISLRTSDFNCGNFTANMTVVARNENYCDGIEWKYFDCHIGDGDTVFFDYTFENETIATKKLNSPLKSGDIIKYVMKGNENSIVVQVFRNNCNIPEATFSHDFGYYNDYSSPISFMTIPTLRHPSTDLISISITKIPYVEKAEYATTAGIAETVLYEDEGTNPDYAGVKYRLVIKNGELFVEAIA